MRLQATKLSPRAPIFAQCVWRREKNPLGARPRRLNLQPIEQPRAYVDPAPLKQSARLNAIQNQDGNAPSHRLKLREREIANDSPENQPRLINVAA